MTVFSFHPVKIITTGEGGMVLTNSKESYEKLARLRSHGITRDPALMEEDSHGPWYYQEIELGFNYRMTDMQAALGLSQLKRLDEFVARRQQLVDRYNQALSNLPLVLPYQHPDVYSAFHLYVIRLKLNAMKINRRQVFEELRASGIGVNVHYIPVHTQPYFRTLGFNAGDFPEAEKYYKNAISLPMFPELSEKDQDYVIDTLRDILR
jgi:dTDP-4-amino-4,6-dideoxygalactose transaminase